MCFTASKQNTLEYHQFLYETTGQHQVYKSVNIPEILINIALDEEIPVPVAKNLILDNLHFKSRYADNFIFSPGRTKHLPYPNDKISSDLEEFKFRVEDEEWIVSEGLYVYIDELQAVNKVWYTGNTYVACDINANRLIGVSRNKQEATFTELDISYTSMVKAWNYYVQESGFAKGRLSLMDLKLETC